MGEDPRNLLNDGKRPLVNGHVHDGEAAKKAAKLLGSKANGLTNGYNGLNGLANGHDAIPNGANGVNGVH